MGVALLIHQDLGRLKSESTPGGTSYAYTYDRFGNRTQVDATGAETYTTTYSYDADGNQTSKVAASSTPGLVQFLDPHKNFFLRILP